MSGADPARPEVQLVHEAEREHCRFDTCLALIRRNFDAVVTPAGPGIGAHIERNCLCNFSQLGCGCGIAALDASRMIESKLDAPAASLDHMLHLLVLTVQRLGKSPIR
jgi:hypothetical protein